jgi:AraC family transcriptional regulator
MSNDSRGDAMMTTPLSLRSTPDQTTDKAQIFKQVANQGSQQERHLLRSDFVPWHLAKSDLLATTVQISPSDSVKRHITELHGIVIENIYAQAQVRISLRFDAPTHLLVMYDDGARHDGETSINGLPPSKLRNFANKMTFVPAGHAYYEWHETSTPTHVTYLYLAPAILEKLSDANATYVPRIFFEDAVLSSTATKLKHLIERGHPETVDYLEALATVLAHELSRASPEPTQVSQLSRGGLAGWQMRAVTTYVEEHLDEQISLATLARLARLSQFHFCRAFKHSYGIPPHQYQLQRRIQWAKVLLADRVNSVTDVGLALGYSQTSSFTVAFRKITGQTPNQFRRNFS